MEILKSISRTLALPLVGLVVVYQKTLSPDHGPRKILYPHGFCKFYPTCSEYARLLLLRDGIISLPKIALRVFRCRPNTQPQINLP
jgi:putative component of membrane protein insertase Oxa1/YidC/SpoIIIJ protein YidD